MICVVMVMAIVNYGSYDAALESMINTAIMVNIGRTAVTTGLLGNQRRHPVLREENTFYSWSRGIPAAVSPAPNTSAGWRVVVHPAPAVLPRDFTAPAPVQNSTTQQTQNTELLKLRGYDSAVLRLTHALRSQPFMHSRAQTTMTPVCF